jgi:hypothetical protein
VSRGYFADTRGQDASPVDYTQVTGTAEAALWNATGAAPVPPTGFAANEVRAGQIWQITAHGVTTTPGASATTLTLTPRWGTSTGGTALGASGASNTALISRTNDPWWLTGQLEVRQVGSSGSVVIGGDFTCAAIGTAAANPGQVVFGSTAAVTVDTTVAAGLWMGVTLGGSASWTIKTLGVSFVPLN